MFAADLAAVPFLADQPGSGASLCRLLAPDLGRCIGGSATDCNLCAPAAQHGNLSRQGSGCCRCRCSLLGCRPSPPAAVAAVVVVSASGVRCRGLLPVPARPGGRGKFLRRASPSFLGRARVGCLPWLGCGPTPGCYFPRPRSFLQHTGAGASPGNTGNNPPETPPRKTSTLKPAQTRPASAACPVCGWLRAKSIFRVPNHTSTEPN